MTNFTLDHRLASDCKILGKLDISLLLLMNNSLVPWFILVPETTETEITDLSKIDQENLLKETNLISSFVKDNFDVQKLNIAAIGNIVSQLHIHIVGRSPSDYCWPNVVWGTKEKEPYTDERVKEITALLTKQLGDQLTRHT
ncbi:MAG: HIT family protein [Gammaproteobacteria bacterium]